MHAQHPYACALLIKPSLTTARFAQDCSCGVCKRKLLRRHSPVFTLLACSTQPSSCSTSLCPRFAHRVKSDYGSLCAGIKKIRKVRINAIKSAYGGRSGKENNLYFFNSTYNKYITFISSLLRNIILQFKSFSCGYQGPRTCIWL